MNQQEICVTRSFARDGIEVQFAQHTPTGIAVAQPPEMRVLSQGQIAPPMMFMASSTAQSLMDQLWNIGVRPSDLDRQPALANTWLQDQLGKFIDQATKS